MVTFKKTFKGFYFYKINYVLNAVKLLIIVVFKISLLVRKFEKKLFLL